jgi:hypothetical protein
MLLPGALCIGVRRAWAAESPNYLLVDQAEIDAAKEKAARLPWAKAAMSQLIKDAEGALQSTLDVPSRVVNGDIGTCARKMA